jgi:hypothetical protein
MHTLFSVILIDEQILQYIERKVYAVLGMLAIFQSYISLKSMHVYTKNLKVRNIIDNIIIALKWQTISK